MRQVSDQRGEALGQVDERTSTANSAVVLSDDRQAIVELDPDHPGFRDAAYRERRNAIAQIAIDHRPRTPIPDAPYVEQEHEVWRTVWSSLEPAHRRFACAEYLEYMQRLDLPQDRIPQLSEVSQRVERLAGFRLEPVAGLVHPKVFLSTLADGVFLSTQYIRHYSVPLYTPEPDVVHELIGHAGTLANPTLAELNRLVGLAAKRASCDAALERLGRVYWFTIEFGVVRQQGQLKAFGAGLLSSGGELEAMSRAELQPFDCTAMERRSYDVTRFQPVLYCAESFESMAAALRDYLGRFAD